MDKALAFLLLLIAIPVQAQLVAISTSIPPAGGAPVTPTFVSESSKNSTLTHSLTTNPAGQTACSNYSYCIPLPEPSLSGNIGIVAFQYNHASTGVTATATNDKGDGFTCITAVQVASTGYWTAACYSSSGGNVAAMTAGAQQIKVTFGTTVVTQMMAKAASFYNVATGVALDAGTSFNGTSSSTANVGSVTTTAANDLVYVYVARVGTPAVTSFTAGAGYTLGTTEINDGQASEYGVVAGTGSTTPSMTMASASTYGEVILAFKSATGGTAPTGIHMTHLTSWSTPSNVTGPFTQQFAAITGEFRVLLPSCGGSGPMLPVSVAETGGANTWTTLGTANNQSSSVSGPEFYNANATSAVGLESLTTSGTGDCTTTYESYAGVAASPLVTRTTIANGNPGAGASTLPWTNGTMADGASLGVAMPGPTVGLALLVGGQAFNTTKGITGPAAPTPCAFDTATFGGEALDGPQPIDQNNTWAHCIFTAGQQPNYSFYEASASEAVGGFSGDMVAVYTTTGTAIKNFTENQRTTAGSSLAITVPSTTAGNLVVVSGVVFNSSPARTISTVCFDGTTCAAGNVFTQLTNATSTGSGHGGTSIWYILSAPAGKTTVTVTASGSAANLEAAYAEVQKGTGTWATDTGTHTNNGTSNASTGVAVAPSITTTGAVDYCTGAVTVSGAGIVTAPTAANVYTYGTVIFSSDLSAVTSLLTNTAGAHQPSWVDGSTSDSYSSSHGCFK